MMVPHGSSLYSYHFVITRHNSPFAEFLMMHPGPTEVVPMFAPQLLGEPVPVNGRIRASELDRPGFGVELNRSEEHTSELQSLMRISYAVFCLKKKKHAPNHLPPSNIHH